jgi:hypothetical protein
MCLILDATCSFLKATPAPDEKIVRDALLRALRERGLVPEDSGVSIRVAHAAWTQCSPHQEKCRAVFSNQMFG